MSEEQQPVVENVVADAQQEQGISPEAQTTSEASSEDKSQDRNWREMRQILTERTNEVQELKSQNRALHEEREQTRSPPPPEEIDPTDDDVSTVGQTKKLVRKQADRLDNLEKAIKKREALAVEERLRLKYADYDAVVTGENLKLLHANAPELVNMLKASHEDPYSQALGAYKLMKQFATVGDDAVKLQENQTKPRSVNSIGQTSALSQANAFSRGLTTDLKKQLWTEMKEAAKKA